jgi:hypothetical protein
LGCDHTSSDGRFQRLRTADRKRHVAGNLEAELHQPIAGNELDAGFLVREIGHDDINFIANAGELPVSFALLGWQRDARAQQIVLRMAQYALHARRELQIGEHVRQGVPGSGEHRPEQSHIARAAALEVALAADGGRPRQNRFHILSSDRHGRASQRSLTSRSAS